MILLDRIPGNRSIPLAYLCRKDVIPATDAYGDPPKLLVNKPYAAEYGSVEMMLIERATHSHPLITQDDRMLFDMLSTA